MPDNPNFPDVLNKSKEYGLNYALNHIDELIDLLDSTDSAIKKESAQILKQLSDEFPPAFQNSVLSYEVRTGRDLLMQVNETLKEISAPKEKSKR